MENQRTENREAPFDVGGRDSPFSETGKEGERRAENYSKLAIRISFRRQQHGEEESRKGQTGDAGASVSWLPWGRWPPEKQIIEWVRRPLVLVEVHYLYRVISVFGTFFHTPGLFIPIRQSQVCRDVVRLECDGLQKLFTCPIASPM